MDLSLFRNQFDPVFEERLRFLIQEEEYILQDRFLSEIVEHTHRLLKGGKRLRPYLARLGYIIGDGKDEHAIRVMETALELFHGFCLVHDDIMDKAETRRGVPTIETYALQRLREANRHGDHVNVARSQAILVGDLLFAWALESATEAGYASKGAMKEFYLMIREVMGGQMIDIDTTTREEHQLDLLERKMYLKTAGYSFVHPLCIGVRLASPDATPALLACCTSIGTHLGIAFQLQDDLFDITKTPEKLGKPTLSDIRGSQQTYFTAHLQEHGSQQAKALLAKIMRGAGTEGEVQQLKVALQDSGACEYVQQRIEERITQAKQEIEKMPCGSLVHQDLLVLTDLILHREG